MRKRIYEIVEVAGDDDKVSHVYDLLMIGVIIISIIPLALKNPSVFWAEVDRVCVIIFIIDYVLRLVTADYKYDSQSFGSFARYPFSPMAIVDLLSILPSFIPLNQSFKMLRLLRMSRTIRVLRVFRALRYSKNFEMIMSVIKKSKDSLIAVGTMALGYILISALVIFNVEPESFNSFFEAIYWATVSLTTVGYGDIYPITAIGRVITMFSSILGIAIVALPAGIITAGFMNELSDKKYKDVKDK